MVARGDLKPELAGSSVVFDLEALRIRLGVDNASCGSALPRLLTLPEVARSLNLPPDDIHRLTASGVLSVIRVGALRRWRAAEVTAHAARMNGTEYGDRSSERHEMPVAGDLQVRSP